MVLEPTDVALRMRLAKSRATNTRGESVSPPSSSGAGSSTMSVILTPSLWLSQGGGVLVSVEISRANFTLHSSAVAAAARLADRTRQSLPALASSDFRPRDRPKRGRCAVWWRYAVAASCGSRARHMLTLKWNYVASFCSRRRLYCRLWKCSQRVRRQRVNDECHNLNLKI